MASETGSGAPAPSVAAGLAIAVALGVFALLALRLGSAFLVISEEAVNGSTSSPQVLAMEPDSQGVARQVPTCGSPGAGRTVFLPDRPRWELCLGGKALPIMIAPYFTGMFGWPFALLTKWHHGDILTLRKLGLVVGFLSILLTCAFAGRLGGRAAAVCTAIALATTPTFVLLNGDFFLFESAPWIAAAAGVLVLLRRRDGAGPLSTPRLAVGAFLLGLSLLGNIRLLFLLAPLAFTAWRFGARLRSIRPLQWLAAGTMLLLALSPMIVLKGISPSDVMGDRSGRWAESLASNWHRPGVYLEAAEALIEWWSNAAYLLRFLVGTSSLNVFSAAIATVTAIFVVVDGGRALWRRQGDMLTGACAAMIVAHFGAVALLYSDGIKNYSTLVPVFGLALGAALSRLGKMLPRPAWVIAVVLLVLPLAENVEATTRSMASSRFFLNLKVEKETAAWLRAHRVPHAKYVTWQSLLAGVFDSLTDGEVQVINGHPLMSACENAPAPRDCLVSRLKSFHQWSQEYPIITIVPEDVARYRTELTSPGAAMDSVHLPEISQAAGFEAERRMTFDGPDGMPALAIWSLNVRPQPGDDPSPLDPAAAHPRGLGLPAPFAGPLATNRDPMIAIPGGSCLMGATDGFPDELPVHPITVGPFLMDTHEVTVGSYSACVDAGACTAPGETAAYNDKQLRWRLRLLSEKCNGLRRDRWTHPVNCVDRFQAEDYCRWQGKRLPMEEEWEYAARNGSRNDKYPWGNEPPDEKKLNECGSECEALLTGEGVNWGHLYPGNDGWATTAPVGSYPAGNNIWGVQDLLGNVFEYTNGDYCPYTEPGCHSGKCSARGGGWLVMWPKKARTARRNDDVSWHRSPDVGIRCAQSPPSGG